MNKSYSFLTPLLLTTALSMNPSVFYANPPQPNQLLQPSGVNNSPLITPAPPHSIQKAYILIDVNSGKILAEKNSEERLPPASLTKMMTLYVISNALHNEQIHLTDNVRISQEAWKMVARGCLLKKVNR